MNIYAFFECEGCCRGYAFEETPDEPVEEPVCPVPGCGSELARYVGSVELPMPLPVMN
jgi:hypothetical protein